MRRSRLEAVIPPASPRIRLFDCDFDAVDLPGALRQVENFVESGGFHQGCGVNVDHLVKMSRDPAFRAAVAACDLVTADGTPVVWASRLFGQPLPARVPAIDLFEALLPEAAARGWSVYLLGARSDVLETTTDRLQRRWPTLRIVGRHHGYFEASEERAVATAIRDAAPDLLFIGISSPKKEQLVERQRDLLARVPFVLGVGGAFDITAGHARRAPPWLARAGLEWAFRLAQEPSRLAWRYLVDDLAFLRLLARESLACRQHRRGSDVR